MYSFFIQDFDVSMSYMPEKYNSEPRKMPFKNQEILSIQ